MCAYLGDILCSLDRTISDRLLTVANTVIHQAHIEKIYNFNRIDPIDGGVYIYKKDLVKQED